MDSLFGGLYRDRTVLITGHTGFKGSWLAFWLKRMGARVVGYSLEAPTTPNHLDLLDLGVISVVGDIRDSDKLNRVFAEYKPDIVFHLAAQALVRPSYENPIETYETNVMGTLRVLEACRNVGVRSIVNITSDKAYENKEWVWGYRESDPMGGYDPYSSSKGCADLLVNSYRNSYFNLSDYGQAHNTLLASCRAGNVIGGGDWARDRLLPDIMLSASRGEKVTLRNPRATRPWQHVLEPLAGYLSIGQKLFEGMSEFGDAWNFGPSDEGSISVEQVLNKVKGHWDKVDYEISQRDEILHEALLLKLDCSKARARLGWEGVWNSDVTFEKTVKWYRNYYEHGRLASTEDDVRSYVSDAREKGLPWTRK